MASVTESQVGVGIVGVHGGVAQRVSDAGDIVEIVIGNRGRIGERVGERDRPPGGIVTTLPNVAQCIGNLDQVSG